MKVIRARTAGFCMGVGLALKKLQNVLKQQTDTRICTLGPIIHNPQVLAHFAEQGVICLNDVQEARKDDHVLIRAHGIPKEQEDWLRDTCASVSDATCPKVRKAQLAIAAATANGQTLLLFGEEEHPEVVGLVSYANGNAHVFGCEDELRSLSFIAAPGLVLASQTTQDRGAFEQIAQNVLASYPETVILNTICDATRERQREALEIAAQVDVMVVIGGKQSGNTRRLATLASSAGIPAFHVETIAEIAPGELENYTVAGLTAGASTPGDLIAEAENWLLSL